MNGLSIEPELGFAFDSPDGRIVMIFASQQFRIQNYGFYGSTLPSLAGTVIMVNGFGGRKLVIGPENSGPYGDSCYSRSNFT